jgi:hypothetical protein
MFVLPLAPLLDPHQRDPPQNFPQLINGLVNFFLSAHGLRCALFIGDLVGEQIGVCVEGKGEWFSEQPVPSQH